MLVKRTNLIGLGVLVGLLAVAGRSAAVPFNEIPEAVGDVLGITTPMAQIIMASGILFMVLMPLAMVKMKAIPMAAVCILVLSCLVGVGWLPLWTLIVVVMLAASMFAKFMKGAVGG